MHTRRTSGQREFLKQSLQADTVVAVYDRDAIKTLEVE
jgi:hypothetical protein